MNNEKVLDVNFKSAFLDVSKNSSIRLSGRCTSTPIGVNTLSFSRLDKSIGTFDIMRDICSTPKMNVSAVPIFGRQNLQLPSDYKNSGNQSGVMNILQQHKVHQQFANVDKTFDDRSAKVQPSSSGLSSNQKKETNIVRNKRRSTRHNDSRTPIFKITPKVPKSPRLLTAMRAKLRANREKAKNMNAEIEEKEKKSTTKKRDSCMKPVRTAPKIPPTMAYNKYRITVPMSPKHTQRKKSCKM